jgi:uncharacterized protein YndB with AHSA1/START domain
VTVIERQVTVKAPPSGVFAYLHEPERRAQWDPMVDRAELEGKLGVGGRLHLHGRRKAPSWVGEYRTYSPPRRSVLAFVEGRGMPFRDYTQTLTVAAVKGGSTITLRIEYELPGALRPLDLFTFRGKLTRTTAQAVSRAAEHFS